MAIKTVSLVPYQPSSVPDRLTPIWVMDKTKVTTSAGTGAAVRINRLQSASFSNNTGVIEISEMGAQTRVGGIDDLGEVSYKLDYMSVGINNAAAMVGKTVNQTALSTTTVGLPEFQAATTDIFRFVADKQNNVYGTLYCQDTVIEGYDIDVRANGPMSESISGKGPNATYFAGFVVPKTYIVQAGDITAGVCTLTLTATILGADEDVVKLPTVPGSAPPSYWEQNGSVYFLKIEQIPGANLANNPVRYYEAGHAAAITATYTAGSHHLVFPNAAITAGDLIRLTFLTYNTDSFPLTIPATSPDTTDRAGVHARLIPVTINAVQTTRIQSASIKYSLKRDHVNGVGENTIIYGVPMIPDVSINLDVKESDPTLLSLLATGTATLSGPGFSGGTIANDFVDLSYPTRWQLSPTNAQPFVITLNDPFTSNVLATFTTPQFVVKGIDYSSSNKADNTIRLTGMDIIGALTISFTHP